ncbi:FUSC family protein [Nocardioides montaniterrae]
MTSQRPTAVFLDRAMARGRTSFRARLQRLRSVWWQVGQCALGAGLAWWLAHSVLGHAHPFFAPVAAVVGLGTSYGQRLRRVGEVTLGVAVGVLLGDLFTQWLGTGPWQLTLLVALAMSTALLLDAGALFISQAAVQSIIVSTLATTSSGAFTRWTDALVGGGVALVAASVVPAAALRRPRQQAAQVARKIAQLLRIAADCIEDRDFDHAVGALRDARATDRLVHQLKTAADEGLSVTISPFRLHHREHVRRLAEIVDPLDYALRNTRVLLRRVAVADYRGEPLPASYAEAARSLAEVTDLLSTELEAGQGVDTSLERLRDFASATSDLPRTRELSGEVVLAQLRSITADLLSCAGLDPIAATEAIPPLRG